MNIKLTKKRHQAVLVTVLMAVFVLSGTRASAFSETVTENRTANASAPNVSLINEPVNVTLVTDGEQQDYTYFPVSCGEFLVYTGLDTHNIDHMNVSESVMLYDDAMIDVSTVRYEQFTVTEPFACDYDLIDVDTVPKGEMKVITEGIPGEKEVTYVVKKVDGVAVETEIIAEEVLKPSVNGVAEFGIGGMVTASDGTVYTYSHKKLFEATAYTYVPGLTTMTTATGETLAKGIVAVDPKVIPMHTKMYIASDTFEYGPGVAEDTGGVIKGDIVDLAFMSYDECIQFGRRNMWVYFLD